MPGDRVLASSLGHEQPKDTCSSCFDIECEALWSPYLGAKTLKFGLDDSRLFPQT